MQPIGVLPLIRQLDQKLVELFRSLKPDDWNRRTVAKWWTVKDVAAHLLDGNIRILSMIRDDYYHAKPEIRSYQQLLDYLNNLNADWVQAMKRVSPPMLILLHEITGPMYCDFYSSLDPSGKAAFAVNWAGENESLNWMHIARDYTEKFLHQQQIRDALGNRDIMTREFFYPFMNIFMLALPHTLRDTEAVPGAVVKITVSGDIGGSWAVEKTKQGWEFINEPSATTASVELHPDDAWKLFSKSIRAHDISDRITIHGNNQLAAAALNMVSVMA